MAVGGRQETQKSGDAEFPEAAGPARHSPAAKRCAYTPRQGQYLAFIYYYTKLNGRPPAERDMEIYFRADPMSVHRMVVTLEKRGSIERTPRVGRSIRLLLPRAELPDLD